MEENKKCCCKKQKDVDVKDTQEYPGVAVDHSDDNGVDDALVKERTKTLNNNPRNNDM